MPHSCLEQLELLEKNPSSKQVHPLQEAGVIDARAIEHEDKRSGLFSWSTGVLSSSAMALMSGCGGSGFDPGPSHALIDPSFAQDNFSLLGAASMQSTPKSLVMAVSTTLSASEPSTADATALFNWAQAQYPSLFPPGSKSLIYGSYLYRYYPSTQHYLGVSAQGDSSGDVFVLGPISNNLLTRVGALQGFACLVNGGLCTLSGVNAASRFLHQATLGFTREQLNAFSADSMGQWLDAQAAMPITQSYTETMQAMGFAADANINSAAGMDNVIWRKLITSNDLLRQRVVLMLSEICVLSVLGVPSQWRQFSVANYLDVLERNAFGNYRTLLEQISLTPAMGYYLTFKGNIKANSVTGSQPDENYARELMQLFTIGLIDLNNDGTPKMRGAVALETYTQSDVSGMARVFTGWDLDTSGLTSPYPPLVMQRPMVQVSSRYETGAKNFLGVSIASGTSAVQSLKIALDTVFNHPNLPPFLAKQMIQRLVSSNPSPSYVNRVANAFINNGASVRGDLKAVIKAILMDPEARDMSVISQSPFAGKIREPVVRFLNWAKAFKATSASNLWAVGDLSSTSTALGQSPLRAATVFNFFRPGYVPPNSALADVGLTAPELQIVDETSVAGYINFMQRVVAGSGVGDVKADYTSLIAIAKDSGALLAELNTLLCAQQLSAEMLAGMKAALDTISITTTAGLMNRIYAALILVFACPQYIVLK
ncbi:MAG: DUF1800 domain-containing protein [Betaproteobacteria bacterium]